MSNIELNDKLFDMSVLSSLCVICSVLQIWERIWSGYSVISETDFKKRCVPRRGTWLRDSAVRRQLVPSPLCKRSYRGAQSAWSEGGKILDTFEYLPYFETSDGCTDLAINVALRCSYVSGNYEWPTKIGESNWGRNRHAYAETTDMPNAVIMI
ncbi:hypothetical protein OBBRIDRAFT_807598 [Obba rivulosa]|uniref:Uncharacterized protein n=1 Tax=Obba rivulosa TaxID=1052685 RepID=A0A8E2AJG0_9APHY|nr:hypothetical protein OBBRIDRAFT_807598 [Obba rivulosa]